jgi:hypothetical protein
MKMVERRLAKSNQDRAFEKDHCRNCEVRPWVVQDTGKYECRFGYTSDDFCTKKDWQRCPINKDKSK